MKKILFLLLPLLLSACISKPVVEEKPKTDTPVNNEIIQPAVTPTEETIEKPKTEKPPVKKTETTPTTSDPKTDEMTKELDSLIDEIVGG